MRILRQLTIFGALATGIGVTSAQALPVATTASNPTIALNDNIQKVDWRCGPKWGGSGCSYGYGYYPGYQPYYGYGYYPRRAYYGYRPRRVYRY